VNGVVCFGELMIRLQSRGYEKLVQSSEFEVKFTGAEANVGISCVNYGLPAFIVSQVPDHEIGQACINYLRRYGVDTTHIARGGDRLGILYTETGFSQRPSKVVYDRSNSAFTELDISQEEWQHILADKSWFHFCGTVPAQGPRALKTLENGLKVAKELGLTVSVDLNYRAKLWTHEQARAVMANLMDYVDVGIGNEEDCEAMFGITADGSDFRRGEIDIDSYGAVAEQMVNRFGLKYQAITLRQSISANRNGWSAIIHDGRTCYRSKRYEVEIIDRIGGGDSFSGGLIWAIEAHNDLQFAIDFAVAASALKQTIPGDFNLVNKADVLALMSGDGAGRVQR